MGASAARFPRAIAPQICRRDALEDEAQAILSWWMIETRILEIEQLARRWPRARADHLPRARRNFDLARRNGV
jgi:hypothetical protein